MQISKLVRPDECLCTNDNTFKCENSNLLLIPSWYIVWSALGTEWVLWKQNYKTLGPHCTGVFSPMNSSLFPLKKWKKKMLSLVHVTAFNTSKIFIRNLLHVKGEVHFFGKKYTRTNHIIGCFFLFFFLHMSAQCKIWIIYVTQRHKFASWQTSKFLCGMLLKRKKQHKPPHCVYLPLLLTSYL